MEQTDYEKGAVKLTMPKLEIVNYQPRYANDFRDINLEWLETLFTVEEIDREVLGDPKTHILDPGGQILIALLDDRPVGAGALMQTSPRKFELTKMGVRSSARGHQVGTRLLKALVARAADLGADELYLLSSQKCEAAVHLYEKFGFIHDEKIMQRYGKNYERCDVAMSYPLDPRTPPKRA